MKHRPNTVFFNHLRTTKLSMDLPASWEISTRRATRSTGAHSDNSHESWNQKTLNSTCTVAGFAERWDHRPLKWQFRPAQKLLMLRKIKSIIQGPAGLILTWWWRGTVRGVGSSGAPPPPHSSVNCCLATRFTLAGLQAAVCCLWTHRGIRLLFAIRVRPVLPGKTRVSTNGCLIFTRKKMQKGSISICIYPIISFFPCISAGWK